MALSRTAYQWEHVARRRSSVELLVAAIDCASCWHIGLGKQVRGNQSRRQQLTVQASAWAWEQTGLEPLEKLVLLAAAEGSSPEGGRPDPGSIAAMCDLDTTGVAAVLEALRERDLLDAEYRTA